MKHRGRRTDFTLGSAFGVVGAAIGVLNILLAGAALMLACVFIAVPGVSLIHSWWVLVLLGVGWNFLYIGGTTLLTEVCVPAG